jgi:ElaB/YqjD/DUF883 family membrane-anchored ribosome-binding protein
MCAVPGRVQTDTWGDFCRDLGVPVEAMPFDQSTQDAFCVWCIRRRGALQAVIDGDLERAVTLCSFEWASFPPGRYGQPTTTIDKLRAVFLQYGGWLSNADLIQPAAPIEDRTLDAVTPSTGHAPQEPPKESPMPIPAIILGLIQAAASVLPVIAQIKGDKTQSTATQNINVASKVLDVVATTVGAVNQQQAVEIIQQDPAAARKAEDALRAQFFDLLAYAKEQDAANWERGEKSVADARGFGERMLGKEGWAGIGFGALIGLLSILIIVGAGWMLWRLAELATTDQTTRGLIVGAAIAMLGQVVSYFFGSSSSSRQSGEALRNIAQGKGTSQ